MDEKCPNIAFVKVTSWLDETGIGNSIFAGLFKEQQEWKKFPGTHSPTAPFALIMTLSHHVFQMTHQSTSSLRSTMELNICPQNSLGK